MPSLSKKNKSYLSKHRSSKRRSSKGRSLRKSSRKSLRKSSRRRSSKQTGGAGGPKPKGTMGRAAAAAMRRAAATFGSKKGTMVRPRAGENINLTNINPTFLTRINTKGNTKGPFLTSINQLRNLGYSDNDIRVIERARAQLLRREQQL